jgi:hypothetical protein
MGCSPLHGKLRADMSETSLQPSASQPGAFPHGRFLISKGGHLAAREGDRPPALRFAWRGRDCEAEITGSELRLTATAGRIPFTIEVGAARHAVFGALSDLPAELPEGWRLSLTPDHRLRLETQAASDATAVSVLREMVRFALALDPYLDRLEAAGAG